LIPFSILHAQLTVVENGNVGIGISNPASKFAVNDSGDAKNTVYIRNSSLESGAYALSTITSTPSPGYSDGSEYVSLGATINSGYGTSRGIIGSCFSSSAQSNGRAFGVYGKAGNATGGFNYGVFGILSGSNQGAAIYGTTETYEEYTGGSFSGYFKGKVYVSNSLTVGNKSTTYPVDVTGTVRATSFLESSDESLKEDISKIDANTISTMKQLRGVSYLLKKPSNSVSTVVSKGSGDSINSPAAITYDSTLYNRRHNGFIAQEVQTIYPELVYEDNDGILSIDYIGFIPIIVETLKKQEDVIATQALEIENLKSALDSYKSSNSDNNLPKAILYQNSPNPFSVCTEVKYYIPEDTKNAIIYISNLQGGLIAQKTLFSTGDGSIEINGSELKAGMYIYTLVVDGKEIDTKRMILTE
jgi:hypothetical protein